MACEPLLLALYPCRHSTYCGPGIATQPALPGSSEVQEPEQHSGPRGGAPKRRSNLMGRNFWGGWNILAEWERRVSLLHKQQSRLLVQPKSPAPSQPTVGQPLPRWGEAICLIRLKCYVFFKNRCQIVDTEGGYTWEQRFAICWSKALRAGAIGHGKDRSATSAYYA